MLPLMTQENLHFTKKKFLFKVHFFLSNSDKRLPPRQCFSHNGTCVCNSFNDSTVLVVSKFLGRGERKINSTLLPLLQQTSHDTSTEKMVNFAWKVAERNQWHSTFCKRWYSGDCSYMLFTNAQIPSMSSSPLTSSNSMLSSSSSSPKLTVSLIFACSGSSP